MNKEVSDKISKSIMESEETDFYGELQTYLSRKQYPDGATKVEKGTIRK